MHYKIQVVIFVLLWLGVAISYAQESTSENSLVNEAIEPEQAQIEKSLESSLTLSEEDKRWMLEQAKCCQKINIRDDITTEFRTLMSRDAADAKKALILSNDPNQKAALKSAEMGLKNDCFIFYAQTESTSLGKTS